MRRVASDVSARARAGRRPHHAATALAAVLVALVLAPSAVLAAGPERPTVQPPSEIGAESAVLQGTLDPGKTGEAGTFPALTYEFLYRESTKECTGGLIAPEESPGIGLGGAPEPVAQQVTELKPHTTYTACLLAREGIATTTSTPIKFTTAAKVQTPRTEKPTAVSGTSATLHATLNPEEATEPGYYRFRYAPSPDACNATGETVQPAEPGAPSAGKHNEPAELTVALRPGTTYTACAIAAGTDGEQAEGTPQTFTTPTVAAGISEPGATALTGTSATITATLETGALPTEYDAETLTETEHTEHGWADAQHTPATPAEAPASREPVAVREQLTGLQPNTTYRYRYTATNSESEEPATTTEATFTTAPDTTNTAPDNRAYEVVSNSGNTGEPYAPVAPERGIEDNSYSTGLVQVAENGEKATYFGEPSNEGGSGATGPGEGNQWLATRTPAGWTTTDITPPDGEVGSTYQAFDPELNTGYLQTNLQPVLAPGAPTGCHILYASTPATGTTTTLETTTQTPGECGKPLFAGASTDHTNVILQTTAALTTGAIPVTEYAAGHTLHDGEGADSGEPCLYACNLYLAHAGELTLVNRLPGPNGATVPNASFGGFSREGRPDLSGAISNDGHEIFWTDTQEGEHMEHIYMLKDATQETQISGEGQAQYWTATPDGRYAYYTEAGQLYRYDTTGEKREALTPSDAETQGVIGVSEDATMLYFVADHALNATANSKHETPVEGQPNLYLQHGNETVFIATLSAEDDKTYVEQQGPEGEPNGDWAPSLGDRTAEITPDGRHLIFQSVKPLTGYDNESPHQENVQPKGPLPEVFVYDQENAAVTCASCSPVGTPPSVREAQPNETQLPVSYESSTTIPRWISNNGSRVFFATAQPLLPQDHNKVTDVYEWERQGEGTCDAARADPNNSGCVFLLSGGQSEDHSYLIGSDATGDNVFLTHRGPLGGNEITAERVALYDARVNGGFTPSTTGCATTCRNSGTPAAAVAPPSATVTGAGNYPPVPPAVHHETAEQRREHQLAAALKACQRKRGRARRRTCERTARKRYARRTHKTKPSAR